MGIYVTMSMSNRGTSVVVDTDFQHTNLKSRYYVKTTGEVRKIVEEGGIKDNEIEGTLDIVLPPIQGSGAMADYNSSYKFKKDYSGMSGITRMAQEGRRAYDSLRSLMQDMAKDSISENEKRISIASDLKSVYYDARSTRASNVQSKAKSWDSRLNSAQAKARGIRDFEQAFRKESSRLGKVDDFQNSSYLRGKTEQQIEADIKNFYLAVFSLQQFFDFYKVSAPNELRNALVQEASKYGLRYYR